MAYRRPGIEVVQQFQALVPALVLPTLPACVVGPAYQLEDDTSAGTYDGILATYSYPNLAAGAVVDTNELDADELAATQKVIGVKLEDAYIRLSSGSDGTSAVGDQTYTTSSSAFSGLPTTFGSRQFYLELTNSDTDDGKHLIISKTSDTVVELADELQNAIAGTSVYKVLELVSEIDYAGTFADVGGTLTATSGITADADEVTLPSNLPSDPDDVTSDPVEEAGDVQISYRALRTDLADSLDVYTDLDSLESVFGVGNVVPTNPYAYGVNVALNNTTTNVNATGLRSTFFTDENAAYQSALEFLESEDVYGVCPLTQSTTVHQTLDTHVEGQSVSTVGRERIGFINRKLSTYAVEVPTSGVGYETTAGTNNGTSAAGVNTTFKDPTNGNFIGDGITTAMLVEIAAGGYTEVEGADSTRTPTPVTGVSTDTITVATKTIELTIAGAFTGLTSADVGRTIRYASTTGGLNDGDYTIESVTNSTTAVVEEAFGGADEQGDTSPFTWQIFEKTLSTTQAAYLEGTRHAIDSVDSNTQITFDVDPTGGFFGTLEDVQYRITDDLTKDEQATFLAGYATSFANRRLVSVWPDTCYITVSGTATELPGYYLGCALTGLTAGLPSQQGFTNLSLTGFTALDNSNNYFSDSQLDTIAGGGNLIIAQDVAEAPVYCRHQLTTDTSTIQFQELSVTKNVDLISRFFRKLYAPYTGIYNITDALLDILKSITVAGITFLKDQTSPRVGGVLRDGSISELAEDSTLPDTVNITIDINIPYPLNNIKVTLLV
jgi:hypothetical protein